MTFVRSPRPEDLERVSRIADSSLKEDYDRELFYHLYEAKNSIFKVAQNESRIIGFICGARGEQHSMRILMLAVKREYRRRGVGSSLIESFLGDCMIQSIKRVELEVRPTNIPAQRFYERWGFQQVGTIEDFYTDGEDCIKMVRFL